MRTRRNYLSCGVGCAARAVEKDYSELAAENAKLKEVAQAAEAYRAQAGHTAKCWTLWNGQNRITERQCVCGHDALSVALEGKQDGR